MPLYLAVFNDCNGDSQDCFIRAPKASEAFKMFVAQLYDGELTAAEALDGGDECVRIFEVPAPDGPEGFIGWQTINVTEHRP